MPQPSELGASRCGWAGPSPSSTRKGRKWRASLKSQPRPRSLIEPLLGPCGRFVVLWVVGRVSLVSVCYDPRFAMMRETRASTLIWLAASALLRSFAAAAPTWPNVQDELEDIMFLQTGYRARGFNAPLTPCGFSAAGPGRSTAAEYIRTAFHDTATANVYTGAGGIDASIQFELASSDNAGTGFTDTVAKQSAYLSTRASLADIIAMGMWAGVRVCGGPGIPVRTGRVDATMANNPGVPQPQNSQFSFTQQFLRFGFDTTQMVQLVACGHTVGGVHSAAFPQIVPKGTSPNDVAHFDPTDTQFDPRLAVEYVAGTSTDPLVTAKMGSVSGFNSDFKVFTVDSNATIKAMRDPDYFKSSCQTLFQQMIETVPGGVKLNDVISVYDVKPAAMQLTLTSSTTLNFAGYIRVRTTARAVNSVALTYKDRTGGNGGSISTTAAGTAAGLDDTFAFYSFSASIPATASISSFTVTVNGGETFDNNGGGFPVQDSIMFQKPQSCLVGNALTVVAAARGAAAAPSLVLTLKSSKGGNNPVPALTNQTVTMTAGNTVGPYTLYTGTYTLADGQGATTKFDVTTDSAVDSFKDTSGLGGTCGAPPGQGSSSSTSSSAAATSTLTTKTSTSSSAAATSSTSTSKPATSTSSTSSSAAASTSSSAAATSSTSKPATSTSSTASSTSSSLAAPSGWTYQGCVTEGTGVRALTGASIASGTMTNEVCATYCAKFQYFGTEYSSECYCGNARDSTSTNAPATDCNMKCSGAAGEICGAGNRLSLYKNNNYSLPGSPTLTGYTYQGCYSDGNPRVLSAKSTANGNSMSYEYCSVTSPSLTSPCLVSFHASRRRVAGNHERS